MTGRRRIQTLGFDLDDTLYPERQYMVGGFEAVGEFAARHLGIHDFQKVLLGISEEDPFSRGKTFNLALERLGILYDASLITQMVSIYHHGRRSLVLTPYPEVVPTLTRLRSAYRLVLITDGQPQVQRNKINALALDELVDKVYCTDEFGVESRKPSVLVFQRVMADLRTLGASCVYVANDPYKDFLAPNQLGWLTIQVNREDALAPSDAPRPEYQAQLCITNLTQLTELLETYG